MRQQQAESAEADEPAYTTQELMRLLNLSLHTTNRLIDMLLVNGKLRVTWAAKRQRDGIVRRRQAYQFVEDGRT